MVTDRLIENRSEAQKWIEPIPHFYTHQHSTLHETASFTDLKVYNLEWNEKSHIVFSEFCPWGQNQKLIYLCGQISTIAKIIVMDFE